MLAAGVGSGFLACAERSIDVADGTQQLGLIVDGVETPALVGIRARAGDSGTINPTAAALTSVDGAVAETTASIADLNGGTASLTLASLSNGEYMVNVGAEGGTTGSYFVDVFLPGDTNGDGVVDDGEVHTMVAALVDSVGSGGPIAERLFRRLGVDLNQDFPYEQRDANLDGSVDQLDVDHVLANHATGNAVQVVLLTDTDSPVVVAGLETDTGREPDDGITNDPTVAGTVSDESEITTFEVTLDGAAPADILDTLTGDTFRIDTARLDQIAGGTLADGPHTLLLTAEDSRGNMTTPVELSFQLDTQPPDAPATPDLIAASDTGERSDDDITNDNTPSLASDAEQDALVQLILDGGDGEDTVIGSAIVNSPVTVDVDEDKPLDDGQQTLFATATDIAGNTGAPSDSVTLTIDTQAPVFQTLQLAPESDTGTQGDNITENTVVAIEGLTEAGVFVELRNGQAQIQETDGSGNFLFDEINLEFGSNTLEALVTDVAGNTSVPTPLTIIQNRKPELVSGIDDTSAVEDQSFSLDISGNFQDADTPIDTLVFSAELDEGGAVPAWLTLDPNTGIFSGTPANGDVGTLNVVVTATDTQGESASDTFELDVVNTNDPPQVIESIGDQTADEDSPFDLDAGAAFDDPDLIHDGLEGLTFTATADGGPLPGWLSIDEDTGALNGTPGNDDVGSLQIEVTATDSGDASVSDSFNLDVRNTNDAPQVETEIEDQMVDQDQPFNLDVSGNFTDIDSIHGDTLALSAQLAGGGALPAWLMFDPDTGTFSGTPTNSDVGVLQITVTAEDDAGLTATSTFSLEVNNANDPPVVENQTFNVSPGSGIGTVVGTVAASDPDAGDTVTFEITGGDPDEVFQIDTNTGQITVVKDGFLGNGAGPFVLTVQVTDLQDASSQAQITVEVADNTPPFVDEGIADQSVDEDQAFDFTFAQDAFGDAEDGTNLTYQATLDDDSPLPSWLDFDAENRRFTGLPTNDDVDVLSVKVTASDRFGATASETFQLTVANTNDPPEIVSSIPPQTADEDAQFELDTSIHFDDDDLPLGDSLSFSATEAGTSSLPLWLAIDADSGVLGGTPTNADVGTLDIEVRVRDQSGQSADQTFSLQVRNTNDSPFIDQAIATQTAAADTLFSLAAGDGFGDPDLIHGDMLTFTALADGAALPAWLSINPQTGLLEGTPSEADVGTLEIEVTATDQAAESESQTFTLNVLSQNTPPEVVSEIDDTSTMVDEPFVLDVSGNFTDADGDTLTFSATLANEDPLPGWLSIDPLTGILSGTPSDGDEGILNITVTATDPDMASASSTFQLGVSLENFAPTVLSTALHIAANSDDGAEVGAVEAIDPNSGDVLSFEITSGNATGAFAIDANSGVITVADSGQLFPQALFSLTITVTDSGTPALSDTDTISIVTDPDPASTLVAFSLSATDINGDPLPLVNGVPTVEVGQDFQLVGSVEDTRGFSATGVFAAYEDVFYDDASLVSLIGRETQTLTLSPETTGGTYTLTWNQGGADEETTSPISLGTNINELVANLQAALESLSSIGAGNVEVRHTPIVDDDNPDIVLNQFVFAIEFKGDLAEQDVPELTVDGSNLTVSGGVAEAMIEETIPADVSTDEGFVGAFDFPGPYVNGISARSEARIAGRPDSEEVLGEVGAFDGVDPLQGGVFPVYQVSFNADAAGRVVFVGNPAEDAGQRVLVFGSDTPVPVEQIRYGSLVVDIVPAAANASAAAAQQASWAIAAAASTAADDRAVPSSGDTAPPDEQANQVASSPDGTLVPSAAAGEDSAAALADGSLAEPDALEPVLADIAADVTAGWEEDLIAAADPTAP